jgi:hypothetical protein
MLKLEQNISELKKDNEMLNKTIHEMKSEVIPETIKTAVRLEINEIANELKPSQQPNKPRSFSFNNQSSSSVYNPYREKFSNDADDSISVSGQTESTTIKTAEIINPNNKFNTNEDEELGSIIDGSVLPTSSNNHSDNKRSLFNIFNY